MAILHICFSQIALESVIGEQLPIPLQLERMGDGVSFSFVLSHKKGSITILPSLQKRIQVATQEASPQHF